MTSAATQLDLSIRHYKQSNSGNHWHVVSAAIALFEPGTAPSELGTCNQLRVTLTLEKTVTWQALPEAMSGAAVADTARRGAAMIDVLGRVPSGPRQGRIEER